MNLPVPQVKLPQRHPKDDKGGTQESRVTLASADGALRKMGEKDLLLETSKDRVLKFRLLAKTQFRDPKGEPVRDSLLHPGDRLSVQANTDDPETAVKVILIRAGTDAEREAASGTVAEAKIFTPTADDLKHAHSEPQPRNGEEAASTDGGGANDSHPELRRNPSAGDTSGAAPPVDQVIADARDAAASFNTDLPNFVVHQATTRYHGSTGRDWQAIDVVTAEVAVVDGKEDYRNILVNGRPPQGPVENTGSWSTGEFAVTQEDILNPITAAAFKRRGTDNIAGRDALVYDLAVSHENSHWIIVSAGGRKYNPAYNGSIWIDKETRRVLRIEQRAQDLPGGFTYDKVESVVEYGFVRIEGKEYLLPTTSGNLACTAASGNCVRNEIAFRNYRKFSSDSDIKYDKFASQ